MVSPPITVSPDSLLRDSASIMVERKIGHLIVAVDKTLYGIIDREDVASAYLKF